MKLHFISGLPRAGSTLLCNILAQNPAFHVTSTSGIINPILMVRNQWEQFEEFKANPNHEGKLRVMRGILEAYHHLYEWLEPTSKEGGYSTVFDKSRGWIGYIEMAEMLLQRKIKMLVPVRDLRDCLSSLEKLWRANTGTRLISWEQAFPVEFKTLQGRCKVWSSSGQILGTAFDQISDALQRGFGDRLHFVKFDELTAKPGKTLAVIYKFLEEESFEHDFNNVVQVTKEDDLAGYGIPDLHTIRPKVTPMKPQWPEILGKFGETIPNEVPW